ncbi:hypothetical protein ACIBH1_37275 [Nonomuraea sp. NPDC050663]|uniref:hypothetical protein n=1 Tax=Nonomuraea sp. NPDC050663 TaxID=3364370 RepID=UPI0037AE6BC2
MLHEQARQLSAEQGFVYGEVHAVMGLAECGFLAELRGDPSLAAAAAADAARRAVRAPLPPGEHSDVDRITDAVTATLPRPDFRQAFLEGAQLTPQQAAQRLRDLKLRP